MKKVTAYQPKDNLKTSHRREKGFSFSYTLFDLDNKDVNGNPRTVVEVRAYWGGQTCYACVWVAHVYENGVAGYGSGRADGYGYDKRESACRAALEAAGFEFDTNGQELQPDDALALIAEHFGLTDTFVHHAHA